MAKISMLDYEKRLPLDFNLLDRLTNELQKTHLIVLAAKPSMGKTTLALNIAENMARRGKTALFFSLEMSSKFLPAIAKNVNIDDSCDVRVVNLLSKCKDFKVKHGNNLDLVVMDYLQMIKINETVNDKITGVGKNSEMLKSLAKELDVPVLVLYQLSRNSIPQFSVEYDLGVIEQDADMIWFIR